MRKLQSLGASGTVTGSSYLLTDKNNDTILIDLGMFQGIDNEEKFIQLKQQKKLQKFLLEMLLQFRNTMKKKLVTCYIHKQIPVKATITKLEAFSSHADQRR